MDLAERNSFEKFVDWLEKSINPEIDPCEDFFGFACGNFNEDSFDRTRGEYPPPRYGDPFERILDNATISNPLIQKVRQFYNSLPTDPRRVLQDEGVIDFCGGFPTFNDNWSSNNFDWIKAAAILSALDVDTILFSSVDYLDERKIVLVSTYDLEEIERAEEILKRAAISEEKVCDIMNDVNIIKEKLNSISTGDEGDDSLFQRVRKTYAELREDAFDYQKYFETFLGHPLHDDDIFHLNNEEPDYLDRYFNVFLEASPKTVANYITYKALCSEDSERNNWRLYFCLRHFAPALLSFGFSRYWNQLEEGKRMKVQNIFRNSFKNFTEEVDVDTSLFSEILTNKDKEVLDHVRSFFQLEQIEKEYADLDISPENFFQNIVTLGNRGTTASLRKCFSYRFEEQEMYFDSKNLLEFYFHHLDKPLVFHFSGWNSEMWERIIGGMGIEERIEDFSSVVKLLKEQIKFLNSSEDDEEEFEFINFWIRDFVCAIEKIKRSYQDYQTWLLENEEVVKHQDEILERLNLNSRKLFFVSFMQQYCYEEDEARLAPILAILNSEEFAKEFQCKSESRMNPNNKCIIKWNKR